MKKGILFFLVAAALLCFAVPAIASPPVALPTIEALGPIVDSGYPVVVQEAAPIIAAAPVIAESATSFDAVSALKASIVLVLIIATAAALADFKRIYAFFVARLDKAVGFANGIRRSRRWV